MDRPRILLVEDEAAYVTALVPTLTQEGFTVDVARTGRSAIERFNAQTPDLVLLDVMLPEMSGLDVCRRIRERSSVPIIMVTARADEADTVVGLELGADDYVTKPYRIKELVARMRTALRRNEVRQVLTDSPDEEDIIVQGNIVMDIGRHRVTVEDREVGLTVKEFGLLEALMSNTGRVLSRLQLADMVWESGVGETKTIDVHIMRLRSKLAIGTGKDDCIRTVRGIGYRFDAPLASVDGKALSGS